MVRSLWWSKSISKTYIDTVIETVVIAMEMVMEMEMALTMVLDMVKASLPSLASHHLQRQNEFRAFEISFAVSLVDPNLPGWGMEMEMVMAIISLLLSTLTSFKERRSSNQIIGHVKTRVEHHLALHRRVG